MAESKEELTSSVATQTKTMLMWDLSCNSSTVAYANNLSKATVEKGGHYRNIRGPFWDSGRHIVNIKIVHKTKDGFGIGTMDKSFNVSDNTHIGKTATTHAYWQEGSVFNNNGTIKKFDGYKTGDIVTVDINVDKSTINWAVNGKFLSTDDVITNIPKQVALAATMYYKNDSIQILQYYRM